MWLRVWDTRPQGKSEQKITTPGLEWRTLEVQIAVSALLKLGLDIRRAGWGPKYFVSSLSPFLKLSSLVRKPFTIKPCIWCFKDFSQVGSLPGPEHKDFLDIHSLMRIMYHDYNPKIGKTTYPLHYYNLYAISIVGKRDVWVRNTDFIQLWTNIYLTGREQQKKCLGVISFKTHSSSPSDCAIWSSHLMF